MHACTQTSRVVVGCESSCGVVRRDFGVRARQPGQGGAARAHTGALGLKSAHLARAVHGYSERRRIVQRGDEKALGISSSLSPGLMSSQNSPRRRSACQRAVGAQLDKVRAQRTMPTIWAACAGPLSGRARELNGRFEDAATR